jgi:assimilatory nitrate reductase catalytic subunit
VLNTGRVRDQWHTMTRTGLSPRLGAHAAEPYVEIHPDDAARAGLSAGGLVRVSSAHGAVVVRAMPSEAQRQGSLFVPMHWSAANSSLARVCALVAPATDPHSGQPESKGTPADIAPVPASHYGFLLTRHPLEPTGTVYWARARIAGGWSTVFALESAPRDWNAWAGSMLPADGERLTYEDATTGRYRVAVLGGARVVAVLYVGTEASLSPTAWLKTCFERAAPAERDRRALLAGGPLGGADDGPVVCACFQVGRSRIEAVIAGGAATPADVAAATRAGSNCGSCLPEIRRLAAKSQPRVLTAAE